MNLNDNGKPAEKQGRKVKGSKALKESYDSLATETGFLYVSLCRSLMKEGLFDV